MVVEINGDVFRTSACASLSSVSVSLCEYYNYVDGKQITCKNQMVDLDNIRYCKRRGSCKIDVLIMNKK